MMDNPKRALAGAGAEHVVCVRIFLTDFERDYTAFNRLYTEYFGTDRLPARTTVGVTHLARRHRRGRFDCSPFLSGAGKMWGGS